MELQPGQACSPSRGRTTMLHSICRLAVGEPGENPPTHMDSHLSNPKHKPVTSPTVRKDQRPHPSHTVMKEWSKF